MIKEMPVTWTPARIYRILPVLALTLLLSGCELIGDILQAGFWLGVIVVVAILALIAWLVRKLGGRRGGPPPRA